VLQVTITFVTKNQNLQILGKFNVAFQEFQIHFAALRAPVHVQNIFKKATVSFTANAPVKVNLPVVY
jgi:hypothetical protein